MREKKSKTRFAQPALRGAFLIFFYKKKTKTCENQEEKTQNMREPNKRIKTYN